MQTQTTAPSTHADIAIDATRLLSELETLATFTSIEPSSEGTAVTRIVFTPELIIRASSQPDGSPALAGDRGEAREHWGLLSNLGENFSLGVARNVAGHGEGAERA